MASTILFTHPACLEHDTGPFHPECSDRLRSILQALEEEKFQFLLRRDAPLGSLDAIKRVHQGDYVDAVLGAVPSDGYVQLDADTLMSPGSGEAALRAVGAVCAAVDAVLSGEARNAFCAVRPPGHHAERSVAMGFCLFNNVVVAAAHARAEHGLERVAVVDFDVHHGNGTQHMMEADGHYFYASVHQFPLYPGTGARRETGVGNIVNVCLPAGSGSEPFRVGLEKDIFPQLEAFSPQLLLISAGFDAHVADPLAQLRLATADYRWATEQLTQLAARCCDGRVVSTLEGGYDLEALAASAAAHVEALMAA